MLVANKAEIFGAPAMDLVQNGKEKDSTPQPRSDRDTEAAEILEKSQLFQEGWPQTQRQRRREIGSPKRRG